MSQDDSRVVLGGFDFVGAVRRLCQHIVESVESLHHIRLEQVLFSCASAKPRARYQTLAKVEALRFEGGQLAKVAGENTWYLPKLVTDDGREILYVITFYLPRFLNLDLEKKLDVIFHELWHISPQFDGDLRRFPGRYFLHSSRSRQFHDEVERITQQWWQSNPPEELYNLFRLNYKQLLQRFGAVRGVRVKLPRPATQLGQEEQLCACYPFRLPRRKRCSSGLKS